MKTKTGMEVRILAAAAAACYVFALAACGVATYAPAVLSLASYGDIGPGPHPAASRF